MIDETISDEALSELAEALEDACRELIRRDQKVSASMRGDYCPLGALFKPVFFGVAIRRPTSAIAPLPQSIASGFGFGFDGELLADWQDERAYDIGRMFREVYP